MIYNHILWILQDFFKLHYIFSFGKRKRGLVSICFFICLGFLLSHCMNTAGFLTNYIILSLHVVWTISPNTVWLSVQNYKYSIFNVYLQFWILFTSSTSVIIHTCIHVHQIKLVYIHCSTLCNLVLWWKKNVLTCSQAENLILCLCPLQLKWSERQENMRVSLNLFSSIFFHYLFCACI